MIIVKRVDERQPLLIPQAHRLGVGVVIHAGHQHHIGSVAAGSLNLRDGRTLGDADGSLDAHIAGSESYALRVVASGAGDDASCFLLVGEGGDFVIRTPELESTGLLQAIGLEIEVAARDDALGGHYGGAVDDRVKHPLGVAEHIH